MELYGKILLIAMPCFVVLILIEMGIGLLKGDTINLMDSISSLFSGMTNILKDTLGLTITVLSYPFLLSHLALFQWSAENVVFTYLLCFIIMDFGGYWYHRISHEINYFWNIHIIHHSSEEYNLPCALRQQFAVFTNILSLLIYGILMALIGIPTEVYAIVAPIHLFAQFWYHTKYIKRLGILEKIIVTPSHHRVHHAMNDIYLDKNYSQIFIIWDKLFGTFQEELETVPPVYGVKRPVRTWNPFLINFQHFYLMLHDAVKTSDWKDKFLLWFKPTGYRPKDMEEKYPVYYIKDVQHFEKYNPNYSPLFKAWSEIQMTSIFLLMSFLFYSFGNLHAQEELHYGLFILFSIFSFSSLMDKKFYGWVLEIVKTLWAMIILFQTKDWFQVNNSISNGSTILGVFMLVSFLTNSFFYFKELKETRMVASS
ncbi:MAG: sterol desaturase family protein [Chitinophagales bacterium]|nr:sterol desaturase family protein [Chitinophagales bacterium]